MRRREFIGLIGGVAVSWPLAARAQHVEKVRRIGVLMGFKDWDAQGRMAAFRAGLRAQGWTEGSNIQIEFRLASYGDADRMRDYARELVGLAPDVILASPVRPLIALQRETRIIPIVFVASSDPVGQGLVESLARPGGNATGFSLFEFSIIGKLLELLKQVAPNITRVALVSGADNVSNSFHLRSLEIAAAAIAIQPISLPIPNDDAAIERLIDNFAQQPHGGMILPPDVITTAHRDLIVALAARHRLPAVYASPYMVTNGGLLAYGVNSADLYRQAASYVDRILKGEKPTDLPVQAPTKFETVINLKTAKALGLNVPAQLLATADKVIE
jgi:ABC-type uncharacterized transport system substrate-binding protein